MTDPKTTIQIGSKIRSFDFFWSGFETEGEEACFLEGIVVSLLDGRIQFRVTRSIFDGVDTTSEYLGEEMDTRYTKRGKCRIARGALVVLSY